MSDPTEDLGWPDWGLLAGAVIVATLLYFLIVIGHAMAWPARAWRGRRG